MRSYLFLLTMSVPLAISAAEFSPTFEGYLQCFHDTYGRNGSEHLSAFGINSEQTKATFTSTEQGISVERSIEVEEAYEICTMINALKNEAVRFQPASEGWGFKERSHIFYVSGNNVEKYEVHYRVIVGNESELSQGILRKIRSLQHRK